MRHFQIEKKVGLKLNLSSFYMKKKIIYTMEYRLKFVCVKIDVLKSVLIWRPQLISIKIMTVFFFTRNISPLYYFQKF